MSINPTSQSETRKVTNERTINMTSPSKLKYAVGLLLAFVALLPTHRASADSLTSESRAALHQLVGQNPAAHKVAANAMAVLVFPNVVKAGFIIGGQGGDGILFVHGQASRPLPDGGGILWVAGGRPKIRLRPFLHEPKSVELGKHHARMGDRNRPKVSSWSIREWRGDLQRTRCTAASMLSPSIRRASWQGWVSRDRKSRNSIDDLLTLRFGVRQRSAALG